MTAKGRIVTSQIVTGTALITGPEGQATDRKTGTAREVAKVTSELVQRAGARKATRVYRIEFTDGTVSHASPATTWTLGSGVIANGTALRTQWEATQTSATPAESTTNPEGTTMNDSETTDTAPATPAKATKAPAKATKAPAKATKAPAKAAAPKVTVKDGKATFPIAPSVSEALRERVGTEAPGLSGYFVRYPYASYDLAVKVGEVEGPKWFAVCRHGNHSAGTDKLMGEGGVEKQAAARKSWCTECGAPKAAPAKAPAKVKATPAVEAAPAAPAKAKATRKPRASKAASLKVVK